MGLDLENILNKKGLNKSSLSTKLGKSRSYVQNALKNPTLKTLEEIATVLNVDVKDLFVSTKPVKEEELLERIKDDIEFYLNQKK